MRIRNSFLLAVALLALQFAVISPAMLAFGQSSGTLQGPSTCPTCPQITPGAINTQLGNKVDITNGVATNLTLGGMPTGGSSYTSLTVSSCGGTGYFAAGSGMRGYVQTGTTSTTYCTITLPVSNSSITVGPFCFAQPVGTAHSMFTSGTGIGSNQVTFNFGSAVVSAAFFYLCLN